MANANRQRLVDYKQQYMFPDTILESIYANDEQNSISGKDAILQAILTPDVYNSASNDNIYAVKKNGAAINIDYINKDIFKSLSNLNYAAAGSSAKILTINGSGTFGIQDGADVKVDHAVLADKAEQLKHALTIKTGTGDNDILKFNGSDDISVSKVADSVHADRATALGNSTKPADAGLPFIARGTDNGTVSSLVWPTLNDGEKMLPMISRSGEAYTFNWEDGSALGGGVDIVLAQNSDTPYYITGVASAKAQAKISTLAIGSSSSPIFKGGNLYQTSDETLKHFTEDLKVDLDNLSTIKKGLFYWNDDENKTVDIGVSAQSVEPLYPQIVTETDGIKAVSYSKLSVVALAAIDVLYKRVKELEEEVKILKNNK